MKGRELNPRERMTLEALVAMHAEYGREAVFTSAAVAHIVGSKVAGSLAGLVIDGYALQRNDAEGRVVYSLTDAGFAKHDTATKTQVHLNGTRPS